MRTPGATTLLSRSMSANTHSSLGEVIRKSPLNSAWRPYRKGSRLPSDRQQQQQSGDRDNVSYSDMPNHAPQPDLKGCVSVEGVKWYNKLISTDAPYLADML